MKILITHVYSHDNKGDAAILSVMIQQLKKNFKGSNIYASVFDNFTKNNWKEEAKRIESFLYIIAQHKNTAFIYPYSLYVIFITIFWSLIYRLTGKKINILVSKRLRSLLEHFISSDLILPIGGGYLNRGNSIKETLHLILNLHPIAISKILGKPTILYSQSIGPYNNIIQRFFAKLILSTTDLIIVRENISLGIIKNLGIRKNIIRKSVDAGFLFNTDLNFNIAKELSINKKEIKRPTVGITVRKWLNKQKQERYEGEIAKFCDYIISNRGVNVVFIPQVTADYFKDDDRKVGEKIIRKMIVKNNVWNAGKKYNHYEIKALYSKLDYLVGTRFHSVIFSLTALVPAIAIEYEHKTRGIMQDLGLSEWVIKMEDVNATKLISMFDDLLDKKMLYINTLRVSLAPYLKTAGETMLLVKNKYQELNKKNLILKKDNRLAIKSELAQVKIYGKN